MRFAAVGMLDENMVFVSPLPVAVLRKTDIYNDYCVCDVWLCLIQYAITPSNPYL